MAALDYYDNGWFPIPVRVVQPEGKRPLLKGYAPGRDNPYPDRETVERWVRQYPQALIGLRLPRTILGIDIDAHDGKAGRETLRELVQMVGVPLPATWTSPEISE